MGKAIINPNTHSTTVSRAIGPELPGSPIGNAGSRNGASIKKKKTTGEIPDIKREFILTRSTDDTLDAAVRLFSKSTGASLTNSHFLRVVLKAIAQALPEIEIEAGRIGKLKRPSNARGNEARREKFERTLAAALLAGLRASEPME